MNLWRGKICGINKKFLLSDHISDEKCSVFNPSYLYSNKIHFFCYRHYNNRKRDVRSFLLILGKDGVQKVDLSVSRTYYVADPKIFRIHDTIWISYNTGYSKKQNDIYVQQISPIIGKPLKLIYSHRNKIEKNWGLFSLNNKIFAVYSLQPLVILIRERENEYEWNFRKFFEEKDCNIDRGFTIGTQPFWYCGNYYLIAHKKLKIGPQRIYLGRPVRLEERDGEWKISTSSVYMIHSYTSLLGSYRKLNPKLFSCTYFSGLSIEEGTAYISYGINDVDYSIVEYPFRELWK